MSVRRTPAGARRTRPGLPCWSSCGVDATSLPGTPRGWVPTEVETPIGRLIVYDSVLPWAKMWQVHEAEVLRQGGEWCPLREEYPDLLLMVAGDFNQDRNGAGWYGTRRVRDLLTEALDAAGLPCVTAVDISVGPRWRRRSRRLAGREGP